MIIYYDDCDNCGGCTAVVPRRGGVGAESDPAYHPSQLPTDPAYDAAAVARPPAAHPYLCNPGGRSDMVWMNDKAKVRQSIHRFIVIGIRLE